MSTAHKDILTTTPQGDLNASVSTDRERVEASCDISGACLTSTFESGVDRDRFEADNAEVENQTLNGTPKSHNQDLVFFRANGGNSLNHKEMTVHTGYRAVEIGGREKEKTTYTAENEDVNDNNNATSVDVRRSSCVSVFLNKEIEIQKCNIGLADGLRRDDSITDGRVCDAVNGTVTTNADTANAVAAKNAAHAAKSTKGGTIPQSGVKNRTEGRKKPKSWYSTSKPPVGVYKNGELFGTTTNYSKAVKICEERAAAEGTVYYLKFSQRLLVYCTPESTAYFYGFDSWQTEHRLIMPTSPSDVFATAYAEEKVRQLEETVANNKQTAT